MTDEQRKQLAAQRCADRTNSVSYAKGWRSWSSHNFTSGVYSSCIAFREYAEFADEIACAAKAGDMSRLDELILIDPEEELEREARDLLAAALHKIGFFGTASLLRNSKPLTSNEQVAVAVVKDLLRENKALKG